jgi:hypothetical protein
MKDYKLTDFDTDEARRRAVELRNYTKKLRWKKDSIIYEVFDNGLFNILFIK